MIQILRTELGKPEVHGDDAAGIGVSLTHDSRYCIGVAGMGAQGVDVEVVVERSETEWKALLGPAYHGLLGELASSEPLGRACTRIWTARECVYKALGERTPRLSVHSRAGEALILLAQTDADARCRILTLPMTFTLGPERVLSMIVQSANEEDLESAPELEQDEAASEPEADPPPEMSMAAAALVMAGFDPSSYSMTVDETTGEFILRWPLGFKEGANLDRSAFFTHYFEWMGRIRELAMQPVTEMFAAQTATGRWGMITNSSSIHVVGEPRLGDTIEVRFWTQRDPRQSESTLDLHFDFRRLNRDGLQERIARGEMRVTWVAMLGHGHVRAESFPDYFQTFVDARTPPGTARFHPPALPEPLAPLQLDLGVEYYRRPEGPLRGPTIARKMFETCLQDANVVGNIYFSNFFVWQARLVDRYLQPIIPHVYRAAGTLGELRCVRAEIEHLVDAMPFDDIEVVMSLESLRAGGVTFAFDYFRVQSDGSKLKLAFGQQECVWLVRHDGAPRAGVLPEGLMNDLRARIE